MKKFLLSALLSAASLLATPLSTTVTLVGVPGNAPTLGNVYVSPYTLSVDGQNVAALCIDFSHETKVGTSWSAYLSVDGGSIANTYHPTEAVQYEEEAYIFSQIIKPGITAQKQTDLQEAAWAIMNPDYYGNNKTYAPDSTALQYVTDAQNDYKQVDFTKYTIVSSMNGPLQQEFLIPLTTPEPASFSLIGLGLFAGAGFLLFRHYDRKRMLQSPKLVRRATVPAEGNRPAVVEA